MFDLTALDEQFTRSPRHPGANRLKRVLQAYAPPHTKSELEELHRRFLIDHGLPIPIFNAILQGETRAVETDAHWPHDNLVAQLDGWQFHRTRAQRQRDAANDAELELTGKRVIRLIYNDFAQTPARTARRIALLTPNSPPFEAALTSPP